MVKTRKWLAAPAALALAATLVLAGCGSSSAPGAMDGGTNSQAAAAPQTDAAKGWDSESYELQEGAGGMVEATLTIPQDDRKIIMTAQIQMETLDFAQTCTDLQAACDKAGGFTSATSVNNREYDAARYASFTFKIPPAKYAGFLKELGEYGNVTTRNEQSEDVTGQYVDIQANLDALETEKARLLEMMEVAKNLEELLILQDRLTELQIDINYYTQGKRQLDRLTSYCTVEITVQEVILYTEPLEPEPEVDNSYGARMARAFSETWHLTGVFFQELWLAIIWLLPLLVFALIITVVVVATVKLARRHSRLHPKPEKPQPPAPQPVGPYAPYPAPRPGPGGPPPQRQAPPPQPPRGMPLNHGPAAKPGNAAAPQPPEKPGGNEKKDDKKATGETGGGSEPNSKV